MVKLESVNKGQRLFFLGLAVMANSLFAKGVVAQNMANNVNIKKVVITSKNGTNKIITETDKLELIAAFNKEALVFIINKRNKRQNWTGISDTRQDYFNSLEQAYAEAIVNAGGMIAFDFKTQKFDNIKSEEDKKEFINIYAPELNSGIEYAYQRYQRNPSGTEIKNNYFTSLDMAYYTAVGNMVRAEIKSQEEAKKLAEEKESKSVKNKKTNYKHVTMAKYAANTR